MWSTGIRPLPKAADESEIEFHADRAEFRRRDGDIETCCAVCVVPDADAEVRAVTLINHGLRHREFELTSYAEVCLNDRRADQAHPAFAKLFLERNSIRSAVRFWPDVDLAARTSNRSSRFTRQQRVLCQVLTGTSCVAVRRSSLDCDGQDLAVVGFSGAGRPFRAACNAWLKLCATVVKRVVGTLTLAFRRNARWLAHTSNALDLQ
jgi:Glycosyltransferase family 36